MVRTPIPNPGPSPSLRGRKCALSLTFPLGMEPTLLLPSVILRPSLQNSEQQASLALLGAGILRATLRSTQEECSDLTSYRHYLPQRKFQNILCPVESGHLCLNIEFGKGSRDSDPSSILYCVTEGPREAFGVM